MKAVQVAFEEGTLSELDARDEVKREGRSAVLRRVTEEYLRRRREEEISEKYRQGYADGKGLGEEWEGWVEEAACPDE
jgi:metal-responsive CopG/Arc/MetJ family transcriptional regulator